MNNEETRALVRALETRVEELHLDAEDRCYMGLDIKTLAEYSGYGMCREIICSRYRGNIVVNDYKRELRSWARSKQKWTSPTDEYCNSFKIERDQI